jgi:hypothetical protein
MNDIVARLSVIALLPAAMLAWKHSKIVSAALLLPFFASIYVAARAIELPVEHPVRVLLPAISMAFGFAEGYAEWRQTNHVSRAYALGAIAFMSGLADIAALPTFAAIDGWGVPYLQILFCLAVVAISTIPQRRIPWLISSLS